MYFVEYNKETGAAIGCINFEDKTKPLVPITEKQYIAFIEGTDNMINYQVHDGKLVEVKRAQRSAIAIYKTTQLSEVVNTESLDIGIKVSGGCIRIFAHTDITMAGITILYITLKNNPTRFEAQIQVDLEKLQRVKALTFEIPGIIEQQISIYTANNEIKFGLQTDE